MRDIVTSVKMRTIPKTVRNSKSNNNIFIPEIPYDIPPVEFHRMYQYAKKNRKNPISWTFQKPVEADELIHRAEWIKENKEWEFERR